MLELTRLGRAGEQQTGARRNARLGGAAGGVVLFPGRRLDGQVVDSDEPAQVIRVDDDPAFQAVHPQRGLRADQPGRPRHVDAVQCAFQRCLARLGVVDAVRLDLDFLVSVSQGLRDERKHQNGHRRIGAQIGLGTQRPGQPVFGENRKTEVGARGRERQGTHRRDGGDQGLAHPHILAHCRATTAPDGPRRCSHERLIRAYQQVARYIMEHLETEAPGCWRARWTCCC
ncbi:Uncharacterised protein [Mycobacteroides abscessus subsp. massiliense]|nr:Uncharacterised protein [Mycobacteroides abscessus subsp. massiliense]